MVEVLTMSTPTQQCGSGGLLPCVVLLQTPKPVCLHNDKVTSSFGPSPAEVELPPSDLNLCSAFDILYDCVSLRRDDMMGNRNKNLSAGVF